MLDLAQRPGSGLSQSLEEMELQPLTTTRTEATIRMQNSSFGWSDSSSDIIKKITTNIGPNINLTIVVGPVGCGKSTLLKGILGETPKISGHLAIPSSQIAYCDQIPWVINGSIRDNITGTSEFEIVWYHTVLRACALDIDIGRLPDGDQTVVGSKGVKLSGGQKQRLVCPLN